MSEVTAVADFGDLCANAPCGMLITAFWNGLIALEGKFLRVEWPSQRSTIVRSGLNISGFRRNRRGGYVVTNSQGVWLWDGRKTFHP